MDEALLDGGEAVGGRFVFFIEVVGYLIQIINDLRRKAVYCHTEFKYVITKWPFMSSPGILVFLLIKNTEDTQSL